MIEILDLLIPAEMIWEFSYRLALLGFIVILAIFVGLPIYSRFVSFNHYLDRLNKGLSVVFWKFLPAHALMKLLIFSFLLSIISIVLPIITYALFDSFQFMLLIWKLFNLIGLLILYFTVLIIFLIRFSKGEKDFHFNFFSGFGIAASHEKWYKITLVPFSAIFELIIDSEQLIMTFKHNGKLGFLRRTITTNIRFKRPSDFQTFLEIIRKSKFEFSIKEIKFSPKKIRQLVRTVESHVNPRSEFKEVTFLE